MWSLLASFADVAGINGNSPSSLFTKEALGKGQRDGSLQHALGAEVFAEERVTHANIVHKERR